VAFAVAGLGAFRACSRIGTGRAATAAAASKAGVEPDDSVDPKLSDHLPRQDRSEDKSGGTGTAQPSIVEAPYMGIVCLRRCRAPERQRIAEWCQRRQHRRVEHADNEERPQFACR